MGKYLSYRQRVMIETLYKAKMPVKSIADMTGVCFSTVYKELKRGAVELLDSQLHPYTSYSADVAQQRFEYAQTSKGRPLKIGSDHAYAAYLEHMIKDKRYSPAAAIAAARKAGFTTSVCYTTLYSYIEHGYIGISYKQLPYGRGKRKDKPEEKKPHKVPEAPSIDVRPDYINNRSELGHWEMDCICGKQGTTAALLCLTERVSRVELIRLLPDKTAARVVSVLADLTQHYDIKTLTVDNGSEFRDYHGMKRYVDEVYYCHPYCSSERGSNENANRIIRRWVPKGSVISDYSPEYIQMVQDWLNAMPRRLLGYDSASKLAKAALLCVS